MQDYTSRIEQIIAQVGDVFQPASFPALEELRRLRLPASVVEFYRRFEPRETLENVQPIRIQPIAKIIEDNTELMPGCYSSRHGYVVFATNFSGDAYAYDINVLNASGEPRIVLISHELVSEETTAEEMAKLAKPVAADLGEFLDQFLKGEVDEECIDDYD